MQTFSELMFPFRPRILREADGAGGGGAGGGDAADTGGGDGEGAPAPWWEGDALSQAQRDLLTNKGLTSGDPVDAIARLADMQANAERHMGTPADQLIRKPKGEQTVADWLKANREVVGLPEVADGYDTSTILSELPDGIQVDKDLEAKVRQVAFDHGITPDGLNAVIGAYAGHLGGLLKEAETGLSSSTEEMMGELRSQWGDEAQAKIDLAKQAATTLGQKAGLERGAMEALSAALAEKTGDANVLRLFAEVGAMLGEDSLVQGEKGSALSFRATPAEARAQLAEIYQEDGPFYTAVQDGNQAVMADYQQKIERLTKIAAGA